MLEDKLGIGGKTKIRGVDEYAPLLMAPSGINGVSCVNENGRE